MTNDLVMTALEKAYSSQTPDKPVIFHTDLGTQYTSNYMKILYKKLNLTKNTRNKSKKYPWNLLFLRIFS